MTSATFCLEIHVVRSVVMHFVMIASAYIVHMRRHDVHDDIRRSEHYSLALKGGMLCTDALTQLSLHVSKDRDLGSYELPKICAWRPTM